MVSVTQEMVSALRLLGLRSGSVVLVHSSLRSLGLGPQGAELLWDALRKAVGDDGTILVPTLSYENVTKEHPLFDARTTPACVGAFPEWVRQQRGVLRSVHPTHSVAGLGPDCQDILSGHRDDRTPAGPHSPFRRLRDIGGSILMVGCSLRPNTSMHGVEELTEPPYLFTGETSFTCTDMGGESFTYVYRCHGHFPQRYDRIQNLLTPDELIRGRVAAAECFLINARALWTKANSALESNPLYFTEDDE